MEKVLGVGGWFVRSTDPEALTTWYRDCLGLDLDAHGQWTATGGDSVFAAFPADTEYLGPPTQAVMLNLVVRDLDAMLAQLRDRGADVADEVQDIDGVGRFGWVTDPEGRRVELWQRPG